LNPALRRSLVTVIGSGLPHDHAELAEAVGRLVAEMGFHLLTGGGLGVMEDACRGFASVDSRAGLAIGIIPRTLDGDGPKPGYPNPWVEIPIYTHLPGAGGPDAPDSRNPINVLSAWKILALPGGPGTLAESGLAVRHGKPILALADGEKLAGCGSFLQALDDLGVPWREVRRFGEGWDLEEARRFLLVS
jgi:uncharacterized protein (TIGR00725 family)